MVQRVSEAAVHIAGVEHARIPSGLLVLLGIEVGDTLEDLEWLCGKVARMRIHRMDVDELGLEAA